MLLHSPLPRMGLELIPANVIAGSSRQWAHTLKIDVGKLHGARREPPMPVVDYSGALAGLVVKVADTWSEVRLITDPGFAIGAIVEDPDNFEFREHGMITATDNPNLVRFRPTEPQRQRPRVGMPVISSGFEGSVYPKGLLIGYISQSHSDKYGMAYAEVEPAARFDSLEEVILIDMQPLGPAPKAAAPPTPAPAATPLEWTAVSIDEPAPAGTYENPLRLDDLAPEASDGGSLLDLPETGADLQTVR
ncbi:MAG: Cell shape-determining protein MreC precursor [candidate division BRC1 bacterium ADurb.BinA364]|nr:MAG: Cell shape-determining protein MreC precursor [candidate division BRC1 bacterium ADurb.BinA364]